MIAFNTVWLVKLVNGELTNKSVGKRSTNKMGIVYTYSTCIFFYYSHFIFIFLPLLRHCPTGLSLSFFQVSDFAGWPNQCTDKDQYYSVSCHNSHEAFYTDIHCIIVTKWSIDYFNVILKRWNTIKY